MADGFLENHYEEYERRKQAYLRKKKLKGNFKTAPKAGNIERPEDEAL